MRTPITRAPHPSSVLPRYQCGSDQDNRLVFVVPPRKPIVQPIVHPTPKPLTTPLDRPRFGFSSGTRQCLRPRTLGRSPGGGRQALRKPLYALGPTAAPSKSSATALRRMNARYSSFVIGGLSRSRIPRAWAAPSLSRSITVSAMSLAGST